MWSWTRCTRTHRRYGVSGLVVTHGQYIDKVAWMINVYFFCKYEHPPYLQACFVRPVWIQRGPPVWGGMDRDLCHIRELPSRHLSLMILVVSTKCRLSWLMYQRATRNGDDQASELHRLLWVNKQWDRETLRHIWAFSQRHKTCQNFIVLFSTSSRYHQSTCTAETHFPCSDDIVWGCLSDWDPRPTC